MKNLSCFVILMLVVNFSGGIIMYGRYTADGMKCSYGERGSLTATCVNATNSYFKTTPYRFDHLDETVRCVNCSLQTLETGSFDISGNQIQNLDLSGSLISTIRQKAFMGLIFLKRLLLSNNEIKAIYPLTFNGVKKIIYVNLENNSINTLTDEGFLELISLEILNLKNNHIQNIQTSAFAGLVHLQILDLSYNEISDINQVFHNLTALKLIDLSHNKISKLSSEEFRNLSSLAEIRLNFNLITTVPFLEFYTLKGLKKLDLSNNIINKILPGSFQGLDNLEDLNLSFNNIAEIIPKTFQSLHDLEILNLSNNKVTIFLTSTYSGLPQLRQLNFSKNSLEDVKISGVFSLDNLDTLDLSFNNISDIDYVRLLSRLPKIAYLNLEDNLLNCGLEKEMEEYFAEDNFKFLLFRQEMGATKCVDSPVTSRFHHSKDSRVTEAFEMESSDGTATTVWIFLLISFLIILVSILFYLQFRMYQELKLVGFTAKRTTSEVQLMASD